MPFYAERRQITVLFCDLVGSTPLSTRLDPEDLRNVISGYQAAVGAAVAGLCGYVARFQGDGVLAYFGWPNADEAHAETAVRAALDIVESVRSQQLSVRIGIATGLVVVGDLVGGGAAQECAALGETPNLAARLQVMAEPDAILVSDRTRHQLGRLFDMDDLGPIKLKGFGGSQRAWRVRCQTALSSRSEALYGDTLTPLIGRDEELDQLLRRWRQAKAGEGQVVLLAGEPGIGKSRLIAEFENRLSSESFASLRYFFSPHHRENALHPIVTRWEQEAGFCRSDPPEERLRKLEAVLLPAGTSPEDVVLIANLLAIPVGDRYPKLEFSTQRKKEKTFAALIRRLKSRASQQPLLMLFEDAHWCDPSSLELLDTAVGALSNLPVLIVVSFRPEFQAPWVGHANTSLMMLRRLNQRQAEHLALQVTFGHVLPSSLLDRIVAQTDGVPLFIEELTKAVVETGTGPEALAALLAVPATLQASLMARLDRLPAAKQVAQIGAVIGREFSFSMLAAVARLPEPQLVRGLDELVASGLAFRRGTFPDAVYSFKHVMVQDAAYDSLLRSRRAELHAAIVAVAKSGACVANIEPGVLGHHCAQAGMIADAANYYRMAGECSAERSAAVETRVQLERGLRFSGSLPDGPDRHRLEVELLVALGRILINTKGPIEATEVFGRAVAVCRKLEEPEALARTLFALGNITVHRGDLKASKAISLELLALGEQQADLRITVAARARLGVVACLEGDFASSQGHLSRMLATSAEVSGPVPLDLVITSHPGVLGGGYLAIGLACLGYPEQAVRQIQMTSEQARQLVPSSLALAHSVSSRVLMVLRHDNGLRARAEEQVAISEVHGFPHFLAIGQCCLGWLAAKQGNAADGLRLLSEGLAHLQAIGIEFHGPLVHGLKADILAWSGHEADAVLALDEALAISARTGIEWLDAELHRRKGELSLTGSTPDYAAAEREFKGGIDIARKQGAKLFELRCVVSLAHLWSDQGKRADAYSILAPAYARFTEGFDFPDLEEARILREQLAT